MTSDSLVHGANLGADAPRLRLPERFLFADRARRFRQLANGHGLAEYLRFAAALSDAQQRLLDQLPPVPLATPELLQQCLEHGMPPLAPSGWRRDPLWRALVVQLVEGLRDQVPPEGQAILEMLAGAGPDWLEQQAGQLLAGDLEGLDLGGAPLIGAALQVYWAHLAMALAPDAVAAPEDPTLCPVCGSPPVAALVRGDDQGLRYLQCCLCGSEWHRVRAQCSQCGEDRDLSYFSIDGRADDPVRAEACGVCHTYLKVCFRDRDPLVDPFADDLASLALDILVGEQGYAPSGVNFLLQMGAGEPE